MHGAQKGEVVVDGLTTRQRAIYRFLAHHLLTYQRMPTLQAIGFAFNIRSVNGVFCHLTALAKKGLLRRTARKWAALELAGVRLVPEFDDTPAGQIARRLLENQP